MEMKLRHSQMAMIALRGEHNFWFRSDELGIHTGGVIWRVMYEVLDCYAALFEMHRDYIRFGGLQLLENNFI
jgi:hypothetical protein